MQGRHGGGAGLQHRSDALPQERRVGARQPRRPQRLAHHLRSVRARGADQRRDADRSYCYSFSSSVSFITRARRGSADRAATAAAGGGGCLESQHGGALGEGLHGHHLDGNAAQAPDVDGVAVGVHLQHLGREVRRRAHPAPLLAALERHRQAEVTDLEVLAGRAGRDKAVGRLHVPVQNLLRVQVGKPEGQLKDPADDCVFI